MFQLDFASDFEGGSGGTNTPLPVDDFVKPEATEPKTQFSSTAALVRHLKANNEDFEWYPTTPQILLCVKSDLLRFSESQTNPGWPMCSVLDIGAGNGSALAALTVGPKLAIELSRTLVEQMPADVFVIGADFHAQSLLDKRSQVIYCNPPYKQYESWAVRIIKEANADIIYFVIPERWESNTQILNAIKGRKAQTEIIGQYDFLDAEREARCKVHVVRVDLRTRYHQGESLGTSERNHAVNPFHLWFDTEFMSQVTPDRSEAYLQRMTQIDEIEALRAGHELIASNGLVNMLDKLYERELSSLMELYKGIVGLPSDIAKELQIEPRDVRNALQVKIQGLKAKYWKELFDRIDTLTNRLTSDNRINLLAKLNSHTSIDFNVANATAVLLWAVKQADQYAEPQAVAMVEYLTEEANVKLYRRNARTIAVSNWRQSRIIDIGPYKLEYSIVLHKVGGTSSCGKQVLDNLNTVAITLGFNAADNFKTGGVEVSGKAETYFFICPKTGSKEVLFEARRHQNGNIHLKLNNRFLLKLNVIFGKLKGWLHSVDEVAEELEITPEEAAECFNAQLTLGLKTDPLLMLN